MDITFKINTGELSKTETCRAIFNTMDHAERAEFLNMILHDDIDKLKYDAAHIIEASNSILRIISNLPVYTKEEI